MPCTNHPTFHEHKNTDAYCWYRSVKEKKNLLRIYGKHKETMLSTRETLTSTMGAYLNSFILQPEAVQCVYCFLSVLGTLIVHESVTQALPWGGNERICISSHGLSIEI